MITKKLNKIRRLIKSNRNEKAYMEITDLQKEVDYLKNGNENKKQEIKVQKRKMR